MNISSQITFLYFKDYEKGCQFLEKVLSLEPVFDPGWAKVFRSTGKSFIGAVKASEGSIDSERKGGTLISLTVDNVEDYYDDFVGKVDDLSEIKYFDDIGLRSFFFKGPEGYDFEVQEFLKDDLKELF
ncbi:VOC family protein [Acidaminobacter sp. JC074]|uniref:VOC family protein n=1 Tax=Acidaminobacter sp. JC074 TaxID=2530199 RepID=UPI001F0E72A7|nr:VOC family protein [Acidaminobacter sp. JC074]MCH4888226.1 VOC family protein [Acidaminobacter sp. JC074]